MGREGKLAGSSTSQRSFTFALKLFALSVPTRCPYSFSVEPHPAALLTITSASTWANASRLCRATCRAASRLPVCAYSAPQHTCSRGATTSYPARFKSFTVAAFVSPNSTLCTQPVINPARPRLGPVAGDDTGNSADDPCRG